MYLRGHDQPNSELFFKMVSYGEKIKWNYGGIIPMCTHKFYQSDLLGGALERHRGRVVWLILMWASASLSAPSSSLKKPPHPNHCLHLITYF